MSVTSTYYARAGFNTALTPPRAGIYYTSVGVYNPLTLAFLVQNGVSQAALSAQQAQLFGVPTSGSSPVVQPIEGLASYPYGTYLGPIQAVWVDPTESPGSYPVTLGALGGLVQWTGDVALSATPIYVAPGTSITSVLVTGVTPGVTITVTGHESATVLGTALSDGSGSALVALLEGTGDSIFEVTSSSATTGVVSLNVGTPPTVNAAGGGGTVAYYASLRGVGQTSTPGALTQTGTLTLVGDLVLEGVIQRRVLAITANTATPAIDSDNYENVDITGQSIAITSFTTNLTGTPTADQRLWISITGTTSIALSWGAAFEASTVALPTTTSGTNRLDVGFVYNAATAKWRCVAVA